jgi:D-arginine dehydrogenase
MTSYSKCDIVVIGGGIAGVSLAAHLAEHATVRLLEMEPQPGYHATGRSAALFAESYGNEVIRALSRASRPFLFAPPPGFCAGALVRPRGALVFARAAQAHVLEAFSATTGAGHPLEHLSAAQALQLCPILRPEELCGAIIDRGAADIDVHELLQGYLRLLRARGGTATMNAQVVRLERAHGAWSVSTRDERIRAAIVVNAAGPWAGELGRMAGAHEIGLEPRRRTALLVDPPATGTERWPIVMDAGEQFYFKPEAGLLLLSPCDETPSAPCDAQPDDTDVAIAVDRVERATTLAVRHVRRSWAGLRSFVKDRSPVAGYDPHAPGFFWLAALGGYGIQTAPALSALAAGLVLGRPIGAELPPFDLDPAVLAPARL